MKKRFSLLIVCLLLVGCGVDKDIKKSYENTSKMNSYQLDLRIKGNYNGKQVRETVRITNYMDKQIKIQNSSSNNFLKHQKNIEEYILIINNKKYKITNDKYEEIKDDVSYNDPNVYLDILDNLTKGKENRIEKIGDISYKLYTVTVRKDVMKNALKGTAIENIIFKSDIQGEVWINPDGYVYKVTYYLNEAIDSESMLQLTTSFSSYNKVKEMRLPRNEINRDERKLKETKMDENYSKNN